MKRKALVIDRSTHDSVRICVDAQNASTLLEYVLKEDVEKEFKEIRSLLKENLRNKEKYCKANVSEKASNMFEMRFTKNLRNDRIYCQEMSVSGVRHIIMAELLESKKTQKIDKNTKQRIEKIGGYEYEF